MKKLALDFQRGPRAALWPQAVLALLAFAFAFDVAWTYAETRIEVERLRTRLERLPAAPERQSMLKVAQRPVSEQEWKFARDTIRRLATPWDALFGALERSRIDSVALLSVEPDPEARSVLLQGEARDYLAILSYVENLREQPALSRVHLTRHESRQTEPQRPLQFSISASWGGKQ